MNEDFTPEINEAVSRIVCRQYYCVCCADRVKHGLSCAKNGPRAFLLGILDFEGMLCGSALWMIDVARDALDGKPFNNEYLPIKFSLEDLID